MITEISTGTGIVYSDQGELIVGFRGPEQFLPGGVIFSSKARLSSAINMHLSDSVARSKIRPYKDVSAAAARRCAVILTVEEMVDFSWNVTSGTLERGDSWRHDSPNEVVFMPDGRVVRIYGMDHAHGFITVDYSKGLSGMIADGKYDKCDGTINDECRRLPGLGYNMRNFPVDGEGVHEFETLLVQLNRPTSHEGCMALVKDIDKDRPWLPSKTEHILAYGAKYHNEQLKYPIIGLTPAYRIGCTDHVAVLRSDDLKRKLEDSTTGAWNEKCRFLAVRPRKNAVV